MEKNDLFISYEQGLHNCPLNKELEKKLYKYN